VLRLGFVDVGVNRPINSDWEHVGRWLTLHIIGLSLDKARADSPITL